MTGEDRKKLSDEMLNHMRLDLSCLTDAYHNWRLGKNVFSLGCTERHRITLYYQQVRAFNLVYALENKGLLEKDTKICILGAGPAGIAAASAIAMLGAEVLLLDEKPDIMGVLGSEDKQNKRRLFHPALDRWPDPAWLNNKTDLPLFNWEQTEDETSTQKLRDQFLSELSDIHNCPRTSFRVFTDFKGQPEWKDSQWHVDFGQSTQWHPSTKESGAAITTFDAHVLILAFGFGGDKKPKYPGSFGYFEDDSVLWDQIEKQGVQTKDWPDQESDIFHRVAIASNEDSNDNAAAICCSQGDEIELGHPQIIVSGSGDGALIEAINGVFYSTRNINGNRRDYTLNWLFPKLVEKFQEIDGTWNDLLLKLQELEEIIDSQKFSSEEMLARYKQLEDCAQHKETLKKVDEQLSSTFGVRRKVYLFHKDPHYMGVKNFAFLRFLVWRFVSMRLILPQRIEMTPEIYETWRETKGDRLSCDLEFSSSGLHWKFPDIHFIIPRHGPNWPFSEQSNNYPHLEDSAKALQELNKQDKTREVIWDDAFTKRLRAYSEEGQNP